VELNAGWLADRGCKAITESGGATSVVIADGMTRGPAVRLPSAKRASEVIAWVKNTDNFYLLASAFNSTSRFARLNSVPFNKTTQARSASPPFHSHCVVCRGCRVRVVSCRQDQNRYRG
jgi:hypothetical protein